MHGKDDTRGGMIDKSYFKENNSSVNLLIFIKLFGACKKMTQKLDKQESYYKKDFGVGLYFYT